MKILVEIAPGELLDKVTILELKLERLSDPGKAANVRIEYEALLPMTQSLLEGRPDLAELFAALKDVNGEIWDIEDRVRDCERAKDFGETFVEIARSVYKTNDRRAATKRLINEKLNSRIVEEKSYAAY
jgi:hypothetical protein